MNWLGTKSKTRLDNVSQPLPSYQEIIELLQSIDSSPYFVEALYPAIARYAGKDVTPAGLVDIINKAIQSFCQTKPMGRALEILLVQKVYAFASVLVDDLFFQEGLKKLFPDQ